MARASPTASSSRASGERAMRGRLPAAVSSGRSRVRMGTTTTARPLDPPSGLSGPSTVAPVPGLRLPAPLELNDQLSRVVSSPSNICTGWLGMMVEMACL